MNVLGNRSPAPVHLVALAIHFCAVGVGIFVEVVIVVFAETECHRKIWVKSRDFPFDDLAGPTCMNVLRGISAVPRILAGAAIGSNNLTQAWEYSLPSLFRSADFRRKRYV